MKKALYYLYSIVTVFSLFYGGILMMVNIGKEMFFPYMVVFIIGFVLLLMGALYIMWKKKESKEPNEEEEK